MGKKCRWENGKFKGCNSAKLEWDSYSNVSLEDDIRTGMENYNPKFRFCPYCGANIEKPVEIEIGMFGKFWNEEDEDYVYDIIYNIKYGKYYAYSQYWKNFTPGLPKGFNQDGTPK
jgi:hypothetical protein